MSLISEDLRALHIDVDQKVPKGNNKSEATAQLWHRRLGHISHATVMEMASKGQVKGMEVTNPRKFFCEECKAHRSRAA